MSMDAVTQQYVKHALKLIRVSNNLSADANAAMRRLSQQLKKLLAGENLATLGIVKLRKIIAQADQLVFDSLAGIVGKQSAATAALVSMEAKWATKTGRFDVAATETAISRTINNFTVFGNTVDDHIAVIGQRLSNQVEAQIRLGASAGQTDAEIASRIIGVSATDRGGIMEAARRNVRAVVDGATHSAADAGRRTAMAANGINALQWSAKMDLDVCPDCAERDGKIWLIDGTPVGDAPEWIPPLLHPRCRCIAMPMDIPADEIDTVAQDSSDNFGDWLNTLEEPQQNDILGVGRADIWRSGDLSLAELVGQDGLMMTLAELQSEIDN